MTISTCNYLPAGQDFLVGSGPTERPESRSPRSDASAAIDFQSDLGQMLCDFCFALYSATVKPHHSDRIYSKGIPFDAAAVCKG